MLCMVQLKCLSNSNLRINIVNVPLKYTNSDSKFNVIPIQLGIFWEEEFSNLTIYFFSSINVISMYFFQFNPSMDLYFNREDPFFIIFLPKCLHNQNSRDHKFFHLEISCELNFNRLSCLKGHKWNFTEKC